MEVYARIIVLLLQEALFPIVNPFLPVNERDQESADDHDIIISLSLTLS